MREYETTFVIQPELSDEGVQAVCARVEAILEKQGAIQLFYDDMGRRRLAYSIRNFQKGHYLTLHYLDDGKVVTEVERVLRLDDSVLRYLTVLADPDVSDIEARRVEAAELERIRAERAAERAARELEEAAEREEAAAREEAARAEAAAVVPEGEAAPGSEGEAAPGSEGEAAPGSEGEAAPGSEGEAAPGSEGEAAPGSEGEAAPGSEGEAAALDSAGESDEAKPDDAEEPGEADR